VFETHRFSISATYKNHIYHPLCYKQGLENGRSFQESDLTRFVKKNSKLFILQVSHYSFQKRIRAEDICSVSECILGKHHSTRFFVVEGFLVIDNGCSCHCFLVSDSFCIFASNPKFNDAQKFCSKMCFRNSASNLFLINNHVFHSKMKDC